MPLQKPCMRERKLTLIIPPNCITIIGILFVWGGLCMTNAGKAIKEGYETGNVQQLHNASSNLSTAFKIVGICLMISLVGVVIYIGLIFLVVFAAALSA